IIACDFFTVETVWFRTLYVLVFIELQSRRVHLSTTTAHPDSSWVTQQARNLTMDLEDRSPAVRFLIHDRDAKFSGSFDEVRRSGTRPSSRRSATGPTRRPDPRVLRSRGMTNRSFRPPRARPALGERAATRRAPIVPLAARRACRRTSACVHRRAPHPAPGRT